MMMSSQYETLGWNEQNVLTFPPFRQYLWKSFLRFSSKLMIIVSVQCYIQYMASGLKGQKIPNLVSKFMKFPSKSNLAAFVYFIMWANKFEKFYMIPMPAQMNVYSVVS